MAFVDIIAICWNYERYLPQFIESLHTQSNQNFRVLFYDNNSTDESKAVAKRLFEAFNINYIIISRPKSYYVSANINYVLNNYTTADWIMIISVDDWLGPDAIKNRIQYVHSNTSTKILLSNCVIYYENENKLEYRDFDYNKLKEPILDNLVLGNFFNAPGSFINKLFLQHLGGFDENLTYEDWDMWIRVIKSGYKIDVLDDKMIFYRRHSKSITAVTDMKFYLALKQTLDKHKDVRTYNRAIQVNKYYTLFHAIDMSNNLGFSERLKYFRKLSFWHSQYFLQIGRFFYHYLFPKKKG